MQITIPNEVFSHVLNVVSRVIKSNTNIPILRNVLLDFDKDSLTLLATDLENQLSISLQFKTKEPTKITVHSDTFTKYLNSLPKDTSIDIELTENKLVVKHGNSGAQFVTLPAEEYPTLQSPKKQLITKLDISVLSEIIERTVFAASVDDLRPILTGVHLNLTDSQLEAVALDTYRMSYISLEHKAQTPVAITVPSETLRLLNRVMNDSFLQALADSQEIEIYLGTSESEEGQLIIFKFGPIELTGRLIEGEYPKYKEILKTEGDYTYEISTADFKEALRRVAIFAQNSIGQKVVLTFNNGNLTLESEAKEMGNVSEQIEVTPKSKKEGTLKMGFQLRFLQDAVNVITSDTFNFSSDGELSPAVFTTKEDPGFYHIVMPLKL